MTSSIFGPPTADFDPRAFKFPKTPLPSPETFKEIQPGIFEWLHNLSPDLKTAKITQESAYKVLLWNLSPEIYLNPIFEVLAARKMNVIRKDPNFKETLKNIYNSLDETEKPLPPDDLIDKIYEKFRAPYLDKAGNELQELLDEEFGTHSQETFAKKVYENALPVIRKETSMVMGCYCLRLDIEWFLRDEFKINIPSSSITSPLHS